MRVCDTVTIVKTVLFMLLADAVRRRLLNEASTVECNGKIMNILRRNCWPVGPSNLPVFELSLVVQGLP